MESAIEQGTYDVAEFEGELSVAADNLDVGTTVWFENDRVRVWEILLEPGERGPFHSHTTNYFWTVVEAGRGLQRFDDGTFAVRNYNVGDTKFLEHTPETALVHDLENVGDTTLRFVTVELLDGSTP
ncbi:MAG TPA: cupin domain-containing protein [Acidimicrobiia bacterium]